MPEQQKFKPVTASVDVKGDKEKVSNIMSSANAAINKSPIKREIHSSNQKKRQ